MFHAKDGLCFERQEDGSVKVRKETNAGWGETRRWEITLDKDTWASVIASMSSRGEEAIVVAQRFHSGDYVDGSYRPAETFLVGTNGNYTMDYGGSKTFMQNERQGQ